MSWLDNAIDRARQPFRQGPSETGYMPAGEARRGHGAPNRSLGALTLHFLRYPEEWIHRRIENLALHDPVVIERRVSLDFTLERRLPAAVRNGAGEPIHFVPLAFLKKDPMVKFSVRDETGRAIPILTRGRNGVLALSVMVVLAEALGRSEQPPVGVEGAELPIEIQRDLEEIVFGPPREPEELRELILSQSTRAEMSVDSAAWRDFLADDVEFMEAAKRLSDHFILSVPLTGPSGVRRILKFSYEEHGDQPRLQLPDWLDRAKEAWMGWISGPPPPGRRRRNWKVWLARALGWRPMAIKVEAPSMGQGGSYHLEIEAPEGLQITLAQLRADDDGQLVHERCASRQRVHLYSDVERRGVARVALRPRSFTIVRTAWMISLFTVAILVTTAVLANDLVRNLGAAMSVLLLVPAGLAAYIARSREPSVVTEALLGLRLIAASTGLWSLLAAVVLVVGTRCSAEKVSETVTTTMCSGSDFRAVALIVLALLSLGTWILLSVYLTRVARPPEQVDGAAALQEAEPVA